MGDTRLVDLNALTPVQRLEKFALEWSVLMAGGRYGNLIHGLHSGDQREAQLRHSDLCDLLGLFKESNDAE